MKHRDNSFDLIRHFAALLVLWTHHYPLSGYQSPLFLGWDTYGFVAVTIFFSISGYLMPSSFFNAGDFMTFMSKRCRRIFPGLIMCTFIMCYVIGFMFTSQNKWSYLFSLSTLKTWILFFSFSGRPIEGVFSNFIFKDAINGSLWTLALEFGWYLTIGLALSYTYSWRSIFFFFMGAIIFTFLIKISHFVSDFAFYVVPMSYFAMFGIAFTTGAFMSLTKATWSPFKWPLFFIALLFLLIFKGRPELPIFGTMSLTFLTIMIGTNFSDRFINGKFDFSYGIYIYAFPIQQLVINCMTHRFFLSMFISIFLTLIASFLSYRFVEKPFLRAKLKRNREADVIHQYDPLLKIEEGAL